MPSVTVSLTDRQREYLEGRVASGSYGNVSEVVRDAIRLLEQRDQENQARLRAAIQEGIDSGPAEPWESAEEIKRAARERRDSRRSNKAHTEEL